MFNTTKILISRVKRNEVSSVMSDSVRPHKRQLTRLPHPWDSPGNNSGVGCHFLLQCMKVKSESEVTQSCPTLSNPMDCSLPGSSVHGIFQAVLEWGAIAPPPSSMEPLSLYKGCLVTHPRLGLWLHLLHSHTSSHFPQRGEP